MKALPLTVKATSGSQKPFHTLGFEFVDSPVRGGAEVRIIETVSASAEIQGDGLDINGEGSGGGVAGYCSSGGPLQREFPESLSSNLE